MYPVCLLQNIAYGMLDEEQEFEYVEVITSSVNFVLAYLSYNITRVLNDKNSNNYICASVDMETMLEVCIEVLQPGANVHIFCSAMQFELWYRLLSKEVRAQEVTLQSGSDSNQEKKEGDTGISSKNASTSLHAC